MEEKSSVVGLLHDLGLQMSDREIFTMKRAERSKIAAAIQLSSQSNSKLLDLPDFIIMDILSRLPLASIFACRCVCKLLIRLISENRFAKLYSSKSPFTSIVFTNHFGYYLVELGKGYHNTYRIYLPSHEWKLVGSCNGFMCLLGFSPTEYFRNSLGYCVHICNPILGEYVSLPIHSNENHGGIKDVYGFGFSLATGQYKVLRIKTRTDPSDLMYKKESEAYVLTFGTYKWKNVGNLPYPLNGQFPGAALDGALHWIVDDDNANFATLYAFDIGAELAHPIPSPHNLGKCTNNMSLGVLQNCLCVFDNSHSSHFDIWSMKDYGVATSWTLDRILRASVPVGLERTTLHPITLWKDGEILIKCGRGDLVSYNQNERIITRFETHNMDLLIQVNALATLASNFSSLLTIAMGQCLRIKKVTSSASLMRCSGFDAFFSEDETLFRV